MNHQTIRTLDSNKDIKSYPIKDGFIMSFVEGGVEINLHSFIYPF